VAAVEPTVTEPVATEVVTEPVAEVTPVADGPTEADFAEVAESPTPVTAEPPAADEEA
jgi:hypothetical protein